MRNECQSRRRAARRTETNSTQYVRALTSVDFHVQAVRYRAGLSNSLNEEEKQVCRHARRAVEEYLRGRHDFEAEPVADWLATWMLDPSPAFLQAVAIELQWRQDALIVAETLTEEE